MKWLLVLTAKYFCGGSALVEENDGLDGGHFASPENICTQLVALQTKNEMVHFDFISDDFCFWLVKCKCELCCQKLTLNQQLCNPSSIFECAFFVCVFVWSLTIGLTISFWELKNKVLKLYVCGVVGRIIYFFKKKERKKKIF